MTCQIEKRQGRTFACGWELWRLCLAWRCVDRGQSWGSRQRHGRLLRHCRRNGKDGPQKGCREQCALISFGCHDVFFFDRNIRASDMWKPGAVWMEFFPPEALSQHVLSQSGLAGDVSREITWFELVDLRNSVRERSPVPGSSPAVSPWEMFARLPTHILMLRSALLVSTRRSAEVFCPTVRSCHATDVQILSYFARRPGNAKSSQIMPRETNPVSARTSRSGNSFSPLQSRGRSANLTRRVASGGICPACE